MLWRHLRDNVRLAALLILLLPIVAIGQVEIDPQRPTLTESNTIVKPGIFQLESGGNYGFTDSLWNGGTFMRLGTCRWFEFRSLYDYRTQSLNIGGKIVMLPADNSENIGISAVYSYNHNYYDDFRIALTKSWEDGYYINLNAGYQGSFYNIILFGRQVNRFGCFFEYMYQKEGTKTTIEETDRLHAGITWRLIDNIQIDVNGGLFRRTGPYVGFGLSYYARFVTNKRR